MTVRRLISAACVMLASLLVIGQTLQSLGLGAFDVKEAKPARKPRKRNRRPPPNS